MVVDITRRIQPLPMPLRQTSYGSVSLTLTELTRTAFRVQAQPTTSSTV